MSLTLNAVHRRVLGVLIEKAFSTPEQYPLTVNALVSGCNQKSNRLPVMNLDDGDVINALQELMHRGLAKLTPAPRGARSNRYEHDITSQLPWSPREQAILTELMLRGPQTVGELRTRCGRMVSMPDLPSVQNTLDALAANEPPDVVVMPRAPGQSAVRYRHNFYTAEESPEGTAAAAATPAPPARRTIAPLTDPASAVPPTQAPDAEPRIAALESGIAALESRVADLEARFDSIVGP